MLQSSSSFEKQGRAEELGPHETEVACDNTLGLVLCPGRGIWMLHYLLLNVHSRGQRTMDSRALSTFYTLTRFSPPEHNMVFLSKCQGNFAVLFFLWEEIYCTVLQLEMNFRQVPCVHLGGLQKYTTSSERPRGEWWPMEQLTEPRFKWFWMLIQNQGDM